MRHLVSFFVLGALAFALKRELAHGEQDRALLVVSVPAQASAAEVERAVDQAVLTNLVLSTDAVKVDPVVRDQLLRAMRATRDEHRTDDAALSRALALGVQRVDPVVRERLAFQGEQVLRAHLPVPVPDDAMLSEYLRAHDVRYRVPRQIWFRQLFLSRGLRGAGLDHAAQVLAERFKQAPLSRADERALSDPTMLPASQAAASESEIDARYGPGVGARVFDSPIDTWSGPISSAYGAHFVFVEQQTPEHLPALHEIRARVLADFLHDESERMLRTTLARQRTHYRIEVRRGTP
jgi:hypothetical protein